MERLTKTYEDGSYGVADNLPCGENSYSFKNLLIDTLGKYEDIGLTPEQLLEIDKLYSDMCREVAELKRFKDFFHALYGEGLEIANWHLNGDTEPFDNFYDVAEGA